jgi:hypothetical protein
MSLAQSTGKDGVCLIATKRADKISATLKRSSASFGFCPSNRTMTQSLDDSITKELLMDVTNRLHGNHTFLLPPLLEADKIQNEIGAVNFARRIFPVKRTNILAVLVITLSLIATGCGTSDSVQSVTLSSSGTNTGGFYNLAGADGTLQLSATANYHSGKTVDVTNSVTYTVTVVGTQDEISGYAPLPVYTSSPAPVPISPTGLMTAVASMCTWVDLPSGTPPVLPTPPLYNWEYTGYYQIVANYQGMASQPVAMGVGSQAGNAPDGSCGPH